MENIYARSKETEAGTGRRKGAGAGTEAGARDGEGAKRGAGIREGTVSLSGLSLSSRHHSLFLLDQDHSVNPASL